MQIEDLKYLDDIVLIRNAPTGSDVILHDGRVLPFYQVGFMQKEPNDELLFKSLVDTSDDDLLTPCEWLLLRSFKGV